MEIPSLKKPQLNIFRRGERKRNIYIQFKDLCIKYIPEMINAGINSLKVEGRMKTLICGKRSRNLQKVIDDYFCDPQLYEEQAFVQGGTE